MKVWFKLFRTEKSILFGPRVSWEDLWIRDIYFEFNLGIWTFRMSLKYRPLICYLKHDWGPWRVHSVDAKKDWRRCIRCGKSQKRKAL